MKSVRLDRTGLRHGLDECPPGLLPHALHGGWGGRAGNFTGDLFQDISSDTFIAPLLLLLLLSPCPTAIM